MFLDSLRIVSSTAMFSTRPSEGMKVLCSDLQRLAAATRFARVLWSCLIITELIEMGLYSPGCWGY